MRWLNERLTRVRWLTVPIAAYLLITVALPFAHATTVKRELVHHAAWVLSGCAAMIGIAILGGLVVEGATIAVRKLNRDRS